MYIDVAVAVIINDSNDVFISRRSISQDQGDKWEFPGGKVEKGESVAEALYREVLEEVGIKSYFPTKLMEVEHDYVSKKVRLHVYEVRSWSGYPEGMEGQSTRWVASNNLKDFEFPEANDVIIELLLARE